MLFLEIEENVAEVKDWLKGTAIWSYIINLSIRCAFSYFVLFLSFNKSSLKKKQKRNTRKKLRNLWISNVKWRESNFFVYLLKLCAMVTFKNLYLLHILSVSLCKTFLVCNALRILHSFPSSCALTFTILLIYNHWN